MEHGTQLDFSRMDGLEDVTMVHVRGEVPTSARHAHDSLCLGVVLAGVRAFELGGQTHIAHPGQSVILPPGLVHACPDLGECEYFMLAVSGQVMADLGFEPPRADPSLSPISIDPVLFGLLMRLPTQAAETASPLERRALLLDILNRVPCEAGQPLLPAPEPVKRALRLLDDRFTENLRLEELAAHAGISPFRLNRAFSRHCSMPPHAYQTRLRIKLAKELLAQGASQSETALACGFFDQSHLARCFRKIVGMTPGEYARAYGH